VIDKSASANFVPLNNADDWLHLVLGIAMIGLGVALGQGGARRRSSAATTSELFELGSRGRKLTPGRTRRSGHHGEVAGTT